MAVGKIISDSFETLKQTSGQAASQIAQEPGKIIETSAAQFGAVPPQPDEKQPVSQPQDPVQKALNAEANRKSLNYLEKELQGLRAKQAQELPKQITGQPGYSEEKAIKQLEMKEKEEEKPPLAIAWAKQKGGTGERRKMGSGA